jgi:hypothetical protein
MNRNTVYIIAGAFLVIIVVLMYQLYEERHQTGIEISVGESGISIEER